MLFLRTVTVGCAVMQFLVSRRRVLYVAGAHIHDSPQRHVCGLLSLGCNPASRCTCPVLRLGPAPWKVANADIARPVALRHNVQVGKDRLKDFVPLSFDLTR